MRLSTLAAVLLLATPSAFASTTYQYTGFSVTLSDNIAPAQAGPDVLKTVTAANPTPGINYAYETSTVSWPLALMDLGGTGPLTLNYSISFQADPGWELSSALIMTEIAGLGSTALPAHTNESLSYGPNHNVYENPESVIYSSPSQWGLTTTVFLSDEIAPNWVYGAAPVTSFDYTANISLQRTDQQLVYWDLGSPYDTDSHGLFISAVRIDGAIVAPPPIDPVPEPDTYALMGLGLVGLVSAQRARRRKA